MNTTATIISLLMLLTPAVAVHAVEYPWSVIGQGAVPESPQANEFRRITMPMPDLATGAASFQLPLYTFEAGDVKIALTLKYIGGNGVRADAARFPCGYGWAVLPALRVTRQILGRPDEKYKFVGDTLDGCFEDHKFNFRCKSNQATNDNIRPNPDRYDPERDIFTLHLPDRTMNMVLDKGRFVSPGNGEYRIEHDTGSGLEWIRVWDPYGNIYMFDIPGERVMSNLLCCEWLLSSITITDGRRISLEWTDGGNTSDGVYSASPQSVVIGRRKSGQTMAPFSDLTNAGVYTGFCDHKALSSMTMGRQKVEFAYHVPYKGGRPDFLTDMKVTYDGIERASVEFRYQDELLVSVTDSRTGTYGLEYNWLGRHDTFRKDPWGYSTYYDHRDGNSPCVPTVRFKKMELFSSYYPKDFFELKGINKSVDDSLCMRNILRRVTYPTGASVEWEYEPHRFTPVAFTDSIFSRRIVTDELSKGGGVRVRRMVMRKSADDPEPIERTYEYGEDGNGLAVCEAAPTLDTFIDMALTVFMFDEYREVPYGPTEELRFFINPNSNYLSYGWGTVPLWYNCVREIHRDGEVLHHFASIAERNNIDREDGMILPRRINRLFGSAIKEVRTETFAYVNGKRKRKITESYDWAMETDPAVPVMKSACINRAICQDLPNVIEYDLAPDFTPDGSSMPYRIYYPKEVDPYMYYSCNFETTKTYKSSQYEIMPCYDRLLSRKTVRHDKGDWTQTEEYSYLPGTSLISETSVKKGTATTVTGLVYPSPDGDVTERGMTAMNQRALPLRRWQRTRTASDTLICEYSRGAGSYYRPAAMYSRRAGGNRIRLGSYGYTADRGWRNRVTLPDGLEEVTIYDDSGLPQPRYVLRGNSSVDPAISGIHSVQTAGGNLDRTGGSFELYSFTHMPLVGMTSVTAPDNTTMEYGYDSSGRLSSATQRGLGAGQTYSYVVNDENGRTYIRTATRYGGLAGNEHISVQNYDAYFLPTVTVTGYSDSMVAVLTDHDEYGSPVRKWMPVPAGGWHMTREGYVSSGFYDDSHPYDSVRYEPMVPGEAVSTTRAGSVWHTGDKSSRVRSYASNGTTYKTDGVNGLRQSTYLLKPFLVTESTDEDGRIRSTYVDGYGRTVRSSTGSGDGALNTYYVYNDFGDLIAVVPPELDGSVSIGFDDMSFKQYGYRYEYDSDGRCVRKHLPGREPIDYRYDPMGRCVAERDGNMRDNGLWRIRYYDHMGREAVVTMSSLSESGIDSLASKIRCVTRGPSNDGCGYASTDGSPVDIREPYVLTYYDDYDWVPDTLRKHLSVAHTTFTRSLTTGSVVSCVPDGPVTAIMLYNDYGQPEHVVRTTSMGVLHTATEYRVDGRPTTLPGRIMEELDGTDIRLITDIAYDKGGREVSRTIKYGNGEAVLTTSYNDIGQLSSRSFGKKGGSFSYKYDVHGWPEVYLTKIPSRGNMPPLPAMTTILKYGSGEFPQYSGNISAKTSAVDREYYEYDEFNRLSKTHKLLNKMGLSQIDAYTYNKHSAITSLTRHGMVDNVDGERVYGLSDSIVFHYYGNQPRTLENLMDDMTIYKGQLGIPITILPSGQMSDYGYDSNGNIISDACAGYSYTYDELNLLSSASSSMTRTVQGNYWNKVEYVHDASGMKHRARYSAVIHSFSVGMSLVNQQAPLFERHYVGNFEFEGDSLTRARFGDGFFDGNGKAWYYERDYQGNVTGVIDDSGSYMVRHRYHPYGAPHEVNDSERMQFGGKEFESFMGVNLSDFGARHYNSTSGHWLQPDPMQESYFALSPYAYCAGNPIMNIDPNGEDIFVMVDDGVFGHMAILIENKDKDKEGWYYYSINGVECYELTNGEIGHPYDDIGYDGGWKSPQEFLNSEFNLIGKGENAWYSYDKGLHIYTTKEQDELIQDEFTRIAKEETYNFYSNNCASTVIRAMKHANLKVGYTFPSTEELKTNRSSIKPISYNIALSIFGITFNIPVPYIYRPNNVYDELKDIYINAYELKPTK